MRQQGSKSGLLRGACHRARIRATRWLATTLTRFRGLAARCARGLHLMSLKKRGRNAPPRGSRESRVPDAPIAARVVVGSTRVSHHRSPEHPAFPARWFYGLFRALPGDRACLPPSSPRSLLLENLTPASGRQDHTTSPSARVRSRQQRTSRPSHPASTSVTIAIRPSCEAG